MQIFETKQEIITIIKRIKNMFQQNKLTIHDMKIWHNYTKINKHASSQQEKYKKKGLIRNNLLHGLLLFLRGYFRVQRNLCNYL